MDERDDYAELDQPKRLLHPVLLVFLIVVLAVGLGFAAWMGFLLCVFGRGK